MSMHEVAFTAMSVVPFENQHLRLEFCQLFKSAFLLLDLRYNSETTLLEYLLMTHFVKGRKSFR